MTLTNLSCAIVLSLSLAVLSHGVSASESPPRHSLDQLVTLAVQKHPSVAAAQADLNAARFDIDAARAQYWPTPSIQTQNDNKGGAATVLTLQQPLWTGGRLDAGLNVARSREEASRMALSEVQHTLALRVIAAWGAWMQAQGRIVALTEGMALLNIYAESVNRRIQGGAAGEVDRALVESRLTQLSGELAAARSAERLALARLAQFIGKPLRTEDLVQPKATADIPPSLDTLIAQATASSPALRRMTVDIETARHELERKRAALWPTLNLRAEHQRGDAALTGSTYDSRALLVLEYTPGAGLSAGANIDAAQARALALQDNLEAARRDLIEKVVNDYEEHQSSRERTRDQLRTIQASVDVLASYDRLFIAGKRGWLDVINTARELIQARTSLADFEAQMVASRARLRQHAGEPL